MIVEELIYQSRYEWYRMNNPEPDSILIHPSTLMLLIREIDAKGYFSLPASGNMKYMGLDIIETMSIEENTVRVSKTKP